MGEHSFIPRVCEEKLVYRPSEYAVAVVRKRKLWVVV